MEVNATKRVDTLKESASPVVVNGGGRIKSDWVVVGEHQKHRQKSMEAR
jgi:hypothetical protein